TKDVDLDRPAIVFLLADLHANEAYLEKKRGNRERVAEIDKRFYAFMKDAQEDANKNKRPATLKELLNRVALEAKFRAGVRGEELNAHLEAMRLSPREEYQLRARFIQGLLAEKQGRLDKTRKDMEAVIASKECKDLHFPARLELILINLSSGQPETALALLREIEPMLEKPEQMA